MKIHCTRTHFDLNEFVSTIEQAKMSKTGVAELVIQGAPLGEEGFKALLSCIENSSSLSLINLDSCQFSGETFNTILNALIDNCPNLRRASFANCSFDEMNIEPMIRFIKNTNIHYLNIKISYGSSLLNHDTHQLFYDAILSNNHLQQVFYCNRFRFDESAKTRIASHLETNQRNFINNFKIMTPPQFTADGHLILSDNRTTKFVPFPSFKQRNVHPLANSITHTDEDPHPLKGSGKKPKKLVSIN